MRNIFGVSTHKFDNPAVKGVSVCNPPVKGGLRGAWFGSPPKIGRELEQHTPPSLPYLRGGVRTSSPVSPVKLSSCHSVKLSHGFTLVELMITIAIIGILSATLVPVFSGYIYKAKKTAMMADTKQITTALQVVMAEQGKALKDITGYGCTSCYCTPGLPQAGSFSGNVKTTQPGDVCYDKTTQLWQELKDMTGFGWKVPFRDPWGGMYMIEENFHEYGATDCRHDTVYSAGPSNVREYIWLPDGKPVNQISEIGTLGNLGVHLEFPTTCP